MEADMREISDYADARTEPEHPLLARIAEATRTGLRHADMLSGRQVAALLGILVRFGGCRRVLEVGTFTGYATHAMAMALPPDGEVVTLESNAKYLAIARPFLAEAPWGARIRVVEGDARLTLPLVQGPFDLAYVDADKASYPEYHDRVMERLRPGGLVIYDNVLWKGEVLNPMERKAQILDGLNRLLAADPRVENVLLPVRDGIHLVRKKHPSE